MRQTFFLCTMFFILDNSISVNRARSPLGPKMCNMLCRHTYGCSVFVFSRSHLTCCVACKQSDVGGLTVQVNNTEFQERAVDRKPCHHLSIIIWSRAGAPRCAKGHSEAPRKTMLQEENIGLLVTRRNAYSPTAVYRYSMKQMSHDLYINMTFKFVKSMSYSATARTLLTSSTTPDKIVISYTDHSSSKLIKGNTRCSAMTLDTSRGLFLLAIDHPELQIYTLAVHGTSFKHLFNIQPRRVRRRNIPSAIAKDPIRDIMYLCLPQEILSVDHTGKGRVMHRGGNSHGLAFNPSENALYFGHVMYIKKLSLLANQVQTLADLSQMVSSIVYYENHLLYSTSSSQSIYNIHLKHPNRTYSYWINQIPFGQELVMCILS